MDSLTVHDLTAAYALDALDPGDAQAYEEHLARCEQCRAELAELGGTAAALAFAVDSPVPPRVLRERILAAAHAERDNVTPLRVRWTPTAKVLTAAAAVLAVVFGAWAASLSHALESERSARSRAERAVSVLSDPSAQRIGLSGAQGSLVVAPNGRAALVVQRLAPAPAGRTYEAWVIENGRPARAGTFRGGGATTVLELDRAVPTGARIAVTIERGGGVDAPTTPPVLTTQPL